MLFFYIYYLLERDKVEILEKNFFINYIVIRVTLLTSGFHIAYQCSRQEEIAFREILHDVEMVGVVSHQQELDIVDQFCQSLKNAKFKF